MIRILRSVILLLVVHASAAQAGRARHTYRQQYLAATKKLVLHEDFDTALILRGTLLTPDFRHALSAERARRLGLSEAEERAWLDDNLREASAYHEVVFSADSPVDPRLRFGESEDTWHLHLVADGVAEPLVTVYRVRRPNTLQKALFEHANKWSSLWIARFHRTVERPTHVELRVASGWGHGALTWKPSSNPLRGAR